ncbi:TetR family transcriptional regulator [Sphaerisporangium melleum]|uniref:TetR family transcriptional regulator n=1 Tax=Sphaerisporangium melleum TaxID=321316 RepID=A0A917RJM4_9ACTN|nr:TetR/AcrR family transcriptional regulator [Sphaerisporangium melleum]GGL10829.1 TetR family transcriptional regulator [Sphaerisporangium melleum]GII69097.1 TetR family transcriptional regulator [Sphaerisporangium melleum]
MSVSRSVRERVRAELIGEIKAVARRHLAVEGAAGLSLRAVARELGMVSSAIYRYFPSRDDLLTALIIEAFDAVGTAVEQADAACPREHHLDRWMASCRAIRTWALANPHEYALIHGTPVPGYVAPQDTVAAAARDGIVLTGIVRDAKQAGRLLPVPGLPLTPSSFAPDAERLREVLTPDFSDDLILRTLLAWTQIYGHVSFELFGMYKALIEADRADAFDYTALLQAHILGLKIR